MESDAWPGSLPDWMNRVRFVPMEVCNMARNTRSKLQLERDRAETASLYLQGTTQAAIGERQGFTQQQISYDLKAIRRAWLESSLVDFNERRALELAKLDHLEAVAWAAWDRSDDDKKFLDVVLGCIQKRCKMFGLDAPLKGEISGPGGGPITTEREQFGITDEERENGIIAILESAQRRDPTRVLPLSLPAPENNGV